MSRWPIKMRAGIVLGVMILLVGCNLPQSSVEPAESPTTPAGGTETARQTPTEEAPVPATEIAATPVAVSTADLVAQVKGAFPEKTYEDFNVLALTVPAGAPPLWAIFSTGMRNFDLNPAPSHFVAIFTRSDDGWKELARVDLDAEMAMPDYIDPGSVTQVMVDPDWIWLTVDGGAGAHGGVFELLRFDGMELKIDMSTSAGMPGAGSMQDINGDGIPEVIYNRTEPYIFCYACSVRLVNYQVYRWDHDQQAWIEVGLEPLGDDQPEAVRTPANRAVELANAGLLKDAFAKIEEAVAAADKAAGIDRETLDWDAALIKMLAVARLAQSEDSGYPLLDKVFYGDYSGAVDLMRSYTPEEIFSAESPLIVGTPADGWVGELGQSLKGTAEGALEVAPELGEAYFLKGWGEYLLDPAANAAAARADVQKAAELLPDDDFIQACAAYLGK